MMYLWPKTSSMVGVNKNFGVITTPKNTIVSHGIREGRLWACDNGAFAGFNESDFVQYLEKLTPFIESCLFVVMPDSVADANKTLDLYETWIKKLVYWPVAFVCQDGQESLPLPNADWYFIGGSTNWKLGAGARDCIKRAKKIKKPVHVGRVNSWKRYAYFKALGADSCDGTHPIYEPDQAHKRISKWINNPINLIMDI